jgi:Flp pilus assembly secretin CpaC
MSARCLAYLASAGVVLAGALVALEGQAATPSQQKLQCCTYQVADLVIPGFFDAVLAMGDGEEKRPAAPATTEDRLIGLIVRTVQPQSWAAQGGAATLDYFPLTMSLVVNQTAKAHAQIQALLTDLRRQQDAEVVLATRLVCVSEAGYEKLVQLRGGENFPLVSYLDGPRALQSFLETTQADAQATIMQAPKMTAFNGQKVAFVATEKQAYLTGLDVRPQGGPAFLPRHETFETGLKYAVLPTVDPSRRTVRLDIDLKSISLDSENVQLFPVITPVVPVSQQGEPQPPVMFTQFIQQPRFTTLGVKKTVRVADGKTVVFDLGSRSREVRHEYGSPILGKVPYVNRLFTNVGYSRQTEHVLCLITPRIILNEEQEERHTGFIAGDDVVLARSAEGVGTLPSPVEAPAETSPAPPAANSADRVSQVQLDVVVARVARGKTRALGLENLPNCRMTLATENAALRGGVLGSSADLLARLHALEKKNLAKVLAQPKLITLSGNPANFLDGGEQAVPIPEGLGSVGVQFEEFGTRLNFLPIVLGNGKIHLEVEAEIRAPRNVGPIIPRAVRCGTAEMESGQTFVLGGLEEMTGKGDTELVLMVTPRVVPVEGGALHEE